MHIHFIAIGGAVMHNLAIALHKKGNIVTGSDDEIFEPSRSHLQDHGLLPPEWGWFPERISPRTDAVILGMHARNDNPELSRALELGIRIFSFPEFLYEQTKDKKRIVIAGSHGKTTLTSMVMHALRKNNYRFDYMVGSALEGFDTMVDLDDSNKLAIFEGDEYLTSTLDSRPKFHLYKPDIGLITGIAWDHINVFPVFDDYVNQFRIFAGMISGSLVYYESDEIVKNLAVGQKQRISLFPYGELSSKVSGKSSVVSFQNLSVNLSVFGKYNMQNLAGAMTVCSLLGLDEKSFLRSMTDFRGAARRQEFLAGNDKYEVYLDFAHAPSKVKATVEAFREQFPDKWLVSCLELHTFSSLNRNFLPHYKSCLDKADKAIVFYDPEVVLHKKLPAITSGDVHSAFGIEDLVVLSDKTRIEPFLMSEQKENTVLLIMTSGSFSGLDIRALAKRYCSRAQSSENVIK